MLTNSKEKVIKTLQLYKAYLSKVINGYPALEFKDGAIHWKVGEGGGVNVGKIDKCSKRHDLGTQAVAWANVRTIEDWLEVLNAKEKEVVFWRVMNHDFEETNENQKHQLLYQVLPLKPQKKWSNKYNKFFEIEGVEDKIGVSDRHIRRLLESAFKKLIENPIEL